MFNFIKPKKIGEEIQEKGMTGYKICKRTTVGNFFITIAQKYDKNNLSALAAESTYYLILAIVPFFIFFLNVILFFANSQLPIILQLVQLLPEQSQQIVQSIITPLLKTRSETILSVGILVAFWSTAKGVQGLIRALNTILNAQGAEDNIIFVYLKSIIFTLLWTFNTISTLVLMVYGDALFQYLAMTFSFPQELVMLWKKVVYIMPFWIIMLTLAIFYRYAPRFKKGNRLTWKKAFFSATIGTILWLTITYLYRYYIGHIGDLSITYGPLVGLMALFIWINLSVRAVLFGAEITATLEDIGVFTSRFKTVETGENLPE